MAAKILAVDDEPQFERLLSQRFRKQIKAGTYEFIFATSGEEALKILKEDESIEMVLSDINMPEMNGLTLVSKIKELRPLLKTVIVSAYGDMGNIRSAMNQGAFDFVTKPIDFPDLDATILKTLAEMEVMKQAAEAKNLAATNKKLVEIDQLKTRFFTNISHEFRTPLTVIRGMAEQIEEAPSKWLDKGLFMIRRNSENLLDLVNQILDLRKLQAGKMELELVQQDLISFTQEIMNSFQQLAEAKDLKLELKSSQNELKVDFDPQKLVRVLYNLLSNAIKFNKVGGDIIVNIAEKGDQVKLEVADTGMGIPKEELPHVFDRFFSVSDKQDTNISHLEGTGIGLALVKELILLHEGRIEVESEKDKGSNFIIHIPLRQEGAKSKSEIKIPELRPNVALGSAILELGSATASENLPQLLMVEDNPDIAQFIASCLEGLYQITYAADGQEGIDKALEKVPDLILSDVMMPRVSGYELCNTLKQNEKTSHIPIILLTAKADDDSKISGLQHGADAYLTKPFNKQELLVRMEKLLELRNTLRNRYSNAAAATPEGTGSFEREDSFISNIHSIIEENLDDENFGIQELCRAIGMSRTQLHRKLKALTGKSTSHFIRIFRLNKAKILLQQSDLNISQIAFEVGFKDPKYFSRTFSEEFGISPIQLRK